MKIKTIIAVGAGVVIGLSGAISTQAAKKTKKSPSTTFDIVLKSRNQAGLTNFVYDTVDKNSPDFQKFISPSQFADKFGQTDSTVNQFRDYFKKHKITVSAYPGNVVLRLTGTRADVAKALKPKVNKKSSTKQVTYKLPSHLKDSVPAFVGLTLKPTATKNQHNMDNSSQKVDLTTGPEKFSNEYGPGKFANAYHLNQLYDQHLNGKGQRIGIIATSANFNVSDIQEYWQKNGINADKSRINRVYVQDGAKKSKQLTEMGLLPSQVELSLDIQQAGGVAPGAIVDTYLANSVNENASSTVLYLNAFTKAISDNNDKQLSTSFAPTIEDKQSWFPGTSESLTQYNKALNLIFQQAAAQGTTIFSASGDNGPWQKPMKRQNHLITSSPYVTVVGGTTLPYTKVVNGKYVKVNKERAWGDIETASQATIKRGIFPGGGGGFSAVNETPRFQLGVPGVNTFRALDILKYSKGKFTINKKPTVIMGEGHGRNLPDISGNADAETGYATYASGKELSVVKGKLNKKAVKKWVISGGTSYTAPQMAAANAIMNSGLGQPIGFLNPRIYAMAQTVNSPMTPLDDADNNNNLYYTGQPGKIYNQATGLGTVNFNQLFTNLK